MSGPADPSDLSASTDTSQVTVTAPGDSAPRGPPSAPAAGSSFATASRTAATTPGTPTPRAPAPGTPAARAYAAALPPPAPRASPAPAQGGPLPAAAPATARAPAPAANHAAPAPAAAAPAADAPVDEDEAKRLLVKFANASIPSSKAPAAAGAALLQQLARLAERAGLTVSRNANGTVLFSSGQAETMVLFEEGLFGTIKRDRKSFPAIPLQWNAFERRFEGTQPERAPREGEPEFRVPRRSALAVLTEVILARLSAGEVK